MTDMRVLGVDPGTTKIGYGVVRRGGVALDYGTLMRKSKYTKMSSKIIDQLQYLEQTVEWMIKEFEITHVMAEFVPMAIMSERDRVVAVQNFFRCKAIQHKLYYAEVGSRTVKVHATNDSKASKAMMKETALEKFQLHDIDNMPVDSYDGLWIADYGFSLHPARWWDNNLAGAQ